MTENKTTVRRYMVEWEIPGVFHVLHDAAGRLSTRVAHATIGRGPASPR